MIARLIIVIALVLAGCAPTIDSTFGAGSGGGAAPVSCSDTNPLLVVETDGGCGYRTPRGCDTPWIAEPGDPPTVCTETVGVQRGQYVFQEQADGAACELAAGPDGVCAGGYCCGGDR